MIVSESIIIFVSDHLNQFADGSLAGAIALLQGLYKKNFSIKHAIINSLLCVLITVEMYNIFSMMDVKIVWGSITSLVIGIVGVDYINRALIKFIDGKLEKMK